MRDPWSDIQFAIENLYMLHIVKDASNRTEKNYKILDPVFPKVKANGRTNYLTMRHSISLLTTRNRNSKL